MESQFEFVLKNSKLLKNIDTSKFNFEQIKGSLLTINEGEIVYREGNPSDSVYIIVSGEINLLKKKVLGSTKSFVFYDEDFFGHEEIFEGTSRTSTAVALRDTYLIRLSKYEFELLLNQDRKILDELKAAPVIQSKLVQEEKETEEIKEVKIEEVEKFEEAIPSPKNDSIEENIAEEVSEQDSFEKITLDQTEPDEEQNSDEITFIENTNDSFFASNEDSTGEKLEEVSDEVNFEKITLDIDEPEIKEESVTTENVEETPVIEEQVEPETIEEIPGLEEQIEPEIIAETPEFPQEEKPSIEEEIPEETIQSNFDAVEINEEQQEEENVLDAETEALIKELQNIKDGEEYPTEIDLSEINDEDKKQMDSVIESIDDFSMLEKALGEVSENKDSVPEITKDDQDFLNQLNQNEDFNLYDNQEENTDQELKAVTINDETEKVETEEEKTEIFENGDEFVNDEAIVEESTIPETEADKFEEDKEQLEKFLAEAENLPVFESQEDNIDDNLEIENIAHQHLTEIEEESNNTENKESGNDSGAAMTAEVLETINQAAQLVNSNIKLDDALVNIVDVACSLTDADRGTLYLVDKENDQLWSKIAMGKDIKEIRLNIGEGIAGWVAKSGETVNIKDVQEDERFKSDYDKSSGYLTKTMLCFPIKNKKEEIIGVLQLLNSNNGEFTELDEEILNGLSIHAALALENAYLVEKLLQAERVTSLGKMANFLIQDIKKPILVSKRYAEHLKAKDEEGKHIQVTEMLLEQLTHVADLVQTTSSYSEGKSVLHAASMNFNDAIEDLIVKIDSLVKLKNCRVEKELDSNVNVKIDFKEFSQCFNHIVRNACEAMPEGGVVNIKTKKDEGNVILSIKDNGLGIPDSLKEKIFEPFMSHGKKEGTGLGLSITKKIIEDHGGTVRVESELGEGADFIITFPIASLY